MRGGNSREIIVGVSGASGAGLATRFVRNLSSHRGISRIHLVLSTAALAVARDEVGAEIDSERAYVEFLALAPAARRKIVLHANTNLEAPISSGSYPTAGMAVVPCSAGTLGSIARGTSRGLLQRAADVTLKERRPLVLAFRESPYSLVHIENMRAATMAGAIIVPPSPPFYIAAPSLDRLLDAYCARLARFFGFGLSEEFVWKGPPSRK